MLALSFGGAEAKSLSNKNKHGIDFVEAQKLWDDLSLLELPTNNKDEERHLAIGKIDDKFWSGIFTYRGDKVRIISIRRSRKNEVNAYES